MEDEEKPTFNVEAVLVVGYAVASIDIWNTS